MHSKKPPLVIGWIEHISLPELGLLNIRAKVDTGARTSALHATEISPFQKDGELWVRFVAQLHDEAPNVRVEAPVYDIREIKNTGGVPQERIVIRAALHIAGQSWPISVSLTDRSKMRFPMIVGRTALKKHNIAVHTRRTNLTAN